MSETLVTCEHCGQQHNDVEQYCPVTGKIFRPERIFPSGLVLDGKYRIDSVLGSGGMGAVFSATHTMLDKQLAVKLMLPDQATDQEMVARMVREARLASKTGHRNIILVTDMGWAENGALYFVMEYLDGYTIKKLVNPKDPLPYKRAVSIVDQVLAGLAAVHDHGIVHRDLKPDNVMIIEDENGDEVVKILDFGISKSFTEDTTLELTRTGIVMGSPLYMSPEQAGGAEKIDQRSDIYAAGAILYTLITGRPPLVAPNYNAMIAAILAGGIDPPSKYSKDIPPELDDVLLRALSRDREERFATAKELREALSPFLPHALPPPPDEPSVEMEEVDLAATTVDPPREEDLLVAQAAEFVEVTGEEELIDTEDPLLSDQASDGGMSQKGLMPLDARDEVDTNPIPAGGMIEEIAPHLQTADFEPPPEASVTPGVASPGGFELDTDVAARWEGPRSVQHRPAAAATVPSTLDTLRPSRRAPGPTRQIVFIAILGVIGFALWESRGVIKRFFGAGADSSEVVLTIETTPEDAEVYLGGELQDDRTFTLGRSQTPLQIRVSAPGFFSKSMEVIPSKSRRLTIKLESRF